MAITKTGYCNGSDMLLYVGEKAIGHCTTHTTTLSAETRERAVKPVASNESNAGLWKDKTVVGLAVSITADGLVFYQETENGYKASLSNYAKGQPVDVKCMERGSTTPYLTGSFVITSLERTDAAGDDATYSISLENAGEVTFDDSALTETAA